jgi:hypothetical protein
MAKQVLSQRDLKTQSAISVPAAGFVAMALKLTVFIVVLNQELKKTSYRRRSRWRRYNSSAD